MSVRFIISSSPPCCRSHGAGSGHGLRRPASFLSLLTCHTHRCFGNGDEPLRIDVLATDGAAAVVVALEPLQRGGELIDATSQTLMGREPDVALLADLRGIPLVERARAAAGRRTFIELRRHSELLQARDGGGALLLDPRPERSRFACRGRRLASSWLLCHLSPHIEFSGCV